MSRRRRRIAALAASLACAAVVVTTVAEQVRTGPVGASAAQPAPPGTTPDQTYLYDPTVTAKAGCGDGCPELTIDAYRIVDDEALRDRAEAAVERAATPEWSCRLSVWCDPRDAGYLVPRIAAELAGAGLPEAAVSGTGDGLIVIDHPDACLAGNTEELAVVARRADGSC